MATQYLVGNDGSITMPTAHRAHLSTWSAEFSYVSTNITGFSDSSVRRRLGVIDMTGSAGGTPYYNSANTAPGVDSANADGAALTLTVGTGCTYNPTVVMSGFSFNVDKNGASTIAFNFENCDGAAIVETWDES
jgi:hypothetical protein